ARNVTGVQTCALPIYPAGLLGERPGADPVGGGGVADVRPRVLAGERADRGHHPAVVLVIVVRVEHVVFDRVDVLGRHLDPAVGAAHVVPGGDPVQPPAVGVSAPLG